MAVPGAWRTRIIVGIAPLVGACAAMLGIDELPLASRDAGAIDAEPPDTAGADACDSPDASFCTRACPAYDFCDDFEDEGPDFHRWKAPSVVPNPFRVGPFGATLDLVPSPSEHGTVLVAQAETDGKQEQTIGLIEVVPQPRTGATPRAILTRVKGRLGELT